MSEEQISAIRSRLRKLYTRDEADQWLHSPHVLLGGERPIDALYADVSRIVEQLETGAYI